MNLMPSGHGCLEKSSVFASLLSFEADRQVRWSRGTVPRIDSGECWFEDLSHIDKDFSHWC